MFIATVSIAPVGALGRHFTDGLHTYLAARQVPSPDARGGIGHNDAAQQSIEHQDADTVFFTPGWDGPQQDSTTGLSPSPGVPSNIIEPELASISTTPLFAATSPASSFVSNNAPAAAAASNTQVSHRPDYPSLNPSIGAQPADAPNEHGESLIAGNHEEPPISTLEAAAGPVQANPTLPSVSANDQVADSPIKTSAGLAADIHTIPVSPPALNLPLPIPGVPGVNDSPAPRPSEAKQNSVMHHAKDQNVPQNDAIAEASPLADSQSLPVQGPVSLVDGPFPGGWTSGLNTLEPIMPLQDDTPGSPTVGVSPYTDQVAPQPVPCPPCPTPAPYPPLGDVVQPDDGGANGPCSGQGFRCDECLNGWFCAPQETPAQVLSCGLGWPCFHCTSGSFCIPDTAPEVPAAQGDVPPAPQPAPAPPSLPNIPGPIPPDLPPAPPNESPVAPANGSESGGPGGENDPSTYGDRAGDAARPPIPGDGQPAADTSEIILFPHPSQPPAPNDEAATPSSGVVENNSPPPQGPALGMDPVQEGGPVWNYVGCFQDEIRRALVGAQPLDYLRGNMSPVLCAAHCEARGMSLAGVESGEECWCGTNIRDDAVRIPESCCEMPCQGDPGATCGGDWAIGVFLKAGTDSGTAAPYSLGQT